MEIYVQDDRKYKQEMGENRREVGGEKTSRGDVGI